MQLFLCISDSNGGQGKPWSSAENYNLKDLIGIIDLMFLASIFRVF